MRIGATIAIFCMVLSVNLNGQLTADRPGIADATTPDRPVKCGFGYRPHLTLIKTLGMFKKPTMHAVYFSPDGAFAVHYDTTARGEVDHSPPLKPAQPDGTPVWVVEVAAALDSARNLLLDLGFDPAPDDGNGVYDVYLVDTLRYGVYGETNFNPEDDPIISYIGMDNDFAEDYYFTHGIDAARVTAVHEYFHAVQLAYGWQGGEEFFYDLSSTWFEDVAYPDVDDWVFWFKGGGSNPFGKTPTQPMARTDGYSIAIFGHYLTWWSGEVDIMRQAWERFKSTSATTAIEGSLSLYSGSLTTAWTDFVARLFLNGVDTTYYFHPDQDWLTLPNAGVPQLLSGSQSQVFEGLKPGTAGIRALDLAGPTNLCLQVVDSPPGYEARLVLNTDRLNFSSITRNPWYVTDLTSLSRPILVVGGESGDVEIMATAIDILVPLDYALDFLAPNPVYPYGRIAHTGLTLGYRVAKALPQADHRIVIYNILGQEIFCTQIIRLAGEGSHTLSFPIPAIQQWPSGVYILRFTVDQRHTFTRTFTLLR